MDRVVRILILLILIFVLVYFALSCIHERKLEMIIEVGETALDGENSPRYQDMLIYYDTEYERNAYGYELLVESDGGFVIEKSENVELKEGTYILSGHGEAAELLMEINIGDIVRMDDDGNVTFIRDLYKSNLKNIEMENERLDEIITYKSENLYDIDYNGIKGANLRLEIAKREFLIYFIKSEIDSEQVAEMVQKMHEILDEKFFCTIESRSVELRGLWHRPNRSGIREDDLNGLCEFVNHIKYLGINTLYVETFWHGMTTYYSDYLGLSHPQMAEFSCEEYGNDYMLALISECHKAGIEVHAWFEVLDVQYPGYNMHDYIDPQWIVYNLNGESSKGFIDPSNPEVKEFLLNIISEMLEKYDFDGISYDYIRYYESGEFDGVYEDGGFSENAIALFSDKYGYTGKDLPADVTNDENVRAQWHEFKTDCISSLVEAMTERIRSVSPDTVISVSPYGHLEHAKSIYMQDVSLWCEMGWVDVILPMIYTDNLDIYGETVESFNDICGDVLQIPGVYSLYNGDSLRDTEEIMNVISPFAEGNSIFASQNVISHNEDYYEEVLTVLSESSHEDTAVSPTADVNEVFSAWKNQLRERLGRIYSEKMTDEEISLIKDFLDSPVDEMLTQTDITDMQAKLDLLKSEVEDFSNDAVKARLKEQIKYINGILRFHLRFSYKRD